jgi:hypothetical protein
MDMMRTYNLDNKADVETVLTSYGFHSTGIEQVDKDDVEFLLSLGLHPLSASRRKR